MEENKKDCISCVLQKQPALLPSFGEKNKRGCECFWRGGRVAFLELGSTEQLVEMGSCSGGFPGALWDTRAFPMGQ